MKMFLVDWWHPTRGNLSVFGWERVEAATDEEAETIVHAIFPEHIVWRVTEDGAYKSARHANTY